MSTFALGAGTPWRASAASELAGERTLRASADARYRSLAFDSGLARCRWDVVRVDAGLPSGTQVAFLAYASDADPGIDAVEALDDTEFSPCGAVAGPFDGWTDTLLTTPPGRFLWLRVDLAGTPGAAAELRALRIDFPRNTTLRMMPAVWSTDGGGRDLNERFLALFDAVRGSVLREIRALASVIDPRTTDAASARDFLDWLGGWFDLEIFRAWPEANRRAVVAHAGELFRLRGTARGIMRFVKLALGRDVVVLEGWHDRHWWFASRGRLGCSVLFGPDVVPRATLAGDEPLGTRQIASNPSPQRDPFASRANTMTVLVPQRDGLDDAALTMLRAVVESQRPAHVAVRIATVKPELRLGVAARLGLDAAFGALRPPAILAGALPPRLGVNATLGDRP